MILYRKTKVKIRTPYEDMDFFDIVAEILQGDTLTLHLFIIWLDLLPYVDRYNLKNGFTLKKGRSR